jgi:hypothetical protein
MTTTKVTRGLEILFVALLSIGAGACSKKDQPSAEPPVSEPPSSAVPESTGGAEQTGAAAHRGIFGPESCDSADRISVPADALIAVYFDKDGHETGTNAEIMTGTSNNTMCPVPEEPEEPPPGGCAAGKCPITLSTGKTYCVVCPP